MPSLLRFNGAPFRVDTEALLPAYVLLDDSYGTLQAEAFAASECTCHTCGGVIEKMSDAVVGDHMRYLEHRPGRCVA